MVSVPTAIPKENIGNVITLPQEELIIAVRQHWFILGVGIISTVLLAIVLIIILYFIFHVFIQLSSSFISLSLITLAVAVAIMAKLTVDWYYHLYVVTTRKILEICCQPFFSDMVNDVFLDQVRTTEIDVTILTMVHEFLDMGDVVIVFDRPSHEMVFTLSNIENPRAVGAMLGDALEELMQGGGVWMKKRMVVAEPIRLTEDVISGRMSSRA